MARLTVDGRLQQAAQAAAEAAHGRYAAVVTYGLDQTATRVVCGATDPDGIAATHSALRRHPTAATEPAGSSSDGRAFAVPIQSEGRLYGMIIVLEPNEGDFSVHDRSLATGVADTVAAGLERVTAVEEMQRRVDWLDASALVSRQLLMRSSASVMTIVQQIADHLLRLSEGRRLTIAVTSPDDTSLLEVRVAAGVGAPQLLGRTYPKADSFAGSAMARNRGQLLGTSDAYVSNLHAAPTSRSVPLLAVPIHTGGRATGAIVVSRRHDQPPFDSTDLRMAEDFARQTSLALELAEKRTAHDQLAEKQQHDRAAHTLHDNLIQQLFSIGLALQSAQADLRRGDPTHGVPRAAAHLARAVDDLNESIRQLRATLPPATDVDNPPSSAADAAGPSLDPTVS